MCVLSYPEYDVVGEHQVFVAAADFGILISIVVHLEDRSRVQILVYYTLDVCPKSLYLKSQQVYTICFCWQETGWVVLNFTAV